MTPGTGPADGNSLFNGMTGWFRLQFTRPVDRFLGDCNSRTVYIVMSVHTPHEEHRAALIDSMHRFGAAIDGEPGLIGIHTMEDQRSGRLVGLAIFESPEDAVRLLPTANEAVADDDFETWEAADAEGFRLKEV